jgi:hypothetical protein
MERSAKKHGGCSGVKVTRWRMKRGGTAHLAAYAARWLPVLAALVVLASGQRTEAAPYDIVAHYKTRDDAKTLEDVVEPNGLVSRNSFNADFIDVGLKFKTDPLSKLQLSRVAYLDLYVRDCNVFSCTDGFGAGSRVPDTSAPEQAPRPLSERPVTGDSVRDKTHVVPMPSVEQFASGGAVPVEVEVVAKFTPEFLCSEELGLREANPEPIKPPDGKKIEDFLDPKDADYEYVRGVLFGHGLRTPNKEPIVYSFCKAIHEKILFKGFDEGKRAEHKERLVSKIVAHLNSEQSLGPAFGAKRHSDERMNVYASFIHHFWLLRNWGSIKFFEVPENREWEKYVDKNAAVSIRSPSTTDSVCGTRGPDCSAVLGALVVKLRLQSGSKETVEDEKAVAGDGILSVPLAMSKHLGETAMVELRLPIGEDDDELVVARSNVASVEEIGWITTIPVFTDIQTALSKDAKKLSDIDVQSSIPVSWAINLSAGEAAHAALTFPFVVGVNTRNSPRAADVLKLFAHVSLIMPLENDAKIQRARAAMGAGAMLFNAFTFSWGVTIDAPQHFLLVGVSVPDLTKAAKAFDGSGASTASAAAKK